ncbi:MAG: efflux RND transporter periplasmic adaptor subunit [Bacillota bacterium]|nr:efflux RND transporter periplasmic adaptor subunit [Bacillota bacterium]
MKYILTKEYVESFIFKCKSIKFKKILSFLALTGVFTFSFAGCSILHKEEAVIAPPLVEPDKVVYDEVDVKKGSIEIDVKGSAVFQSANLSNEAFNYGVSYLKSINVKLGDKVKAGQVIAEQETEDLESDLKKKKYKLQMDQLTYERIQNSLDAAADDRTKSDLKIQLEQQQINIEMDKMDVQEAQKNIDHSESKASISGIVTYIDTLNPGDRVTPRKTVVTIADSASLELLYTGNNTDKFNVGAKVDVSYDSKNCTGKVVKDEYNIPSDASNASRKAVKVKLDTKPNDVEIGDSAYITLVIEKKDNVIVIPSSLLHETDGRNYVEMLDQGLRVQRNVETGLKNATDVEIVKGLEEGEKILRE